jgi:hypothetical protein
VDWRSRERHLKMHDDPQRLQHTSSLKREAAWKRRDQPARGARGAVVVGSAVDPRPRVAIGVRGSSSYHLHIVAPSRNRRARQRRGSSLTNSIETPLARDGSCSAA